MQNIMKKTALGVAIAGALGTSFTANAIDPSAVEPNDTHYWQQWHLENKSNIDVDAVTAWEMLKDVPKQEVVVAIIDSAMDTNHFDIKQNLWNNADEIPGNGIDDDNNGLVDDVYGYDFRNDKASVFDGLMLHAHQQAGIIAAETNNDRSTASVSGEFPIKLMPLQMININETTPGSVMTIRNSAKIARAAIDGLEYAIDNDANVINMSINLAKSEEVLRLDAGEVAADVAADYIDRNNKWDDYQVIKAKDVQDRTTEEQAIYDEVSSNPSHYSYANNVVTVIEEDNPDATTEAEIQALTETFVQQTFDDYYVFEGETLQLLQEARAKNILIVNAGVNAYVEDLYSLPDPSPVDNNVIKVGGYTEDGTPAKGVTSSYASEYGKSIRVYAPGENLVSSMPSDDKIWLAGMTTGNSFANPIVSAIAAMAYSVKPNITYGEVIDALEDGVEETPDFLFTLADGSEHQAGRIRAPLVFQELGYALPQGVDSNGVPNAPVATYEVEDCDKRCEGLSPLTVTFDATSSSDPQGSGLTYEWDFGDGSPVVSGAVVTHTYDQPLGGSFDASVTVTDQDGYSDKSKSYRVDVIANGVDYVDIQFTNGYSLQGVLISDDIDITFGWFGAKFVRGSGTVIDANGDEVTVTFETSSSALGTLTGSVEVVTPSETYFDAYSWAPFDYDSTNRTITVDSRDVDWTVINGNDL